jgi:tRNA pseudouridine13 synthase
VLPGDVLQKTDTGGLFDCTDAATDQARLDAGELVVTGPIFGSRTRCAPPSTPAAALEDDALALAAIERSALAALGRSARGTRRPLTMPLRAVEVGEVEPDGLLGPGVSIAFALPAGGYATTLLRELQEPVTTPRFFGF